MSISYRSLSKQRDSLISEGRVREESSGRSICKPRSVGSIKESLQSRSCCQKRVLRSPDRLSRHGSTVVKRRRESRDQQSGGSLLQTRKLGTPRQIGTSVRAHYMVKHSSSLIKTHAMGRCLAEALKIKILNQTYLIQPKAHRMLKVVPSLTTNNNLQPNQVSKKVSTQKILKAI